MEEDSGVKAPVTRLRRRLSVEQSEDVKSPAPSTPTKKRGGRLAAKPQLELIDEHGTNITPSKRTTRKTSTKDVVEATEDKTLTPSRRSTRIKSNTSIVSETTQSYDSPRAKRAARRTSQVGSDSESSVTPARQTRRTRKDSASSVEKLEITLSGKPHITEVIIEEENMSVKSDDTTTTKETSSPASIRKSPRLREKRQDSDRKSLDKPSNEIEIASKSPTEDKLNVSIPKQKNNRKSVETMGNEDPLNIDNTPENPLNVSKQRWRKERTSEEQSINDENVTIDNTPEEQLNISIQNQNKERKSLQTSDNHEITNIDLLKDQSSILKQSRKKDRKSSDETSNNVSSTNNDTSEDQHNVSIQKKGKKSIVNTSNAIDTSNNTSIDTMNISKEYRMKERKSIEKPALGIETLISTDINYVGSVSNESNQLEQEERNSIQCSEIDNSTTANLNNISTNSKPEIRVTPSVSENEHSKDNLSDSSLLMIKEFDKKPKKRSSIINKSTSALENSNSFQNKRQRTKSWTVTSLSQETDEVFFSDNETNKKRINKRSSKEFNRRSNLIGAGDHETNDISNISMADEISGVDATLHSSLKFRKSKEHATPKKSDRKSQTCETISPQGNKENILVSRTSGTINETSTKFFEKGPTAILQSTVYFEDADTDSKGKGSVVKQLDTEDQCVPVVDNQLVEKDVSAKLDDIDSALNQKNDNNDSCEPMDIDETMPNNVSLTEFSQEKNNKTSDGNELNPVAPSSFMDNSLNKSSNKSKRKSSLSNAHNFEKTENENKSTLILSQLKDVSSTEHNVSKSPKLTNDLLSKSVNSSDIVKDKAHNNKNLSQDYSTSTPLQQKKFKKLGMQINSSIIDSSNIDIKQAKASNISKNEMSKISKQSESSSEDEEDTDDEENLSKDKSQFLDNEADEASDDYESGDSRDDSERQYEDENEIREKGETLDSEDDVSNDTDYEKDSFVVSSDEEDNELLSGSGDDLSMSDKELSMSKKSKKKYDERKKKEQKKASKEMYEARHESNKSDVSAKTKKIKKRQQIDSSEDSSEEKILVPVKKNKHLRLDSTHEDDLENDNASKKKMNAKRLSGSAWEETTVTQAKEITICDKSVTQTNDPLLVQVKLEPKTPMKSLNISTVHINENIEEIEVDSDDIANVSIMKPNEQPDPLQATMMEEESSLSENSEIMNNYDSVLNELNNSTNKTKSLKSHDISLNLNKKTKNVKEPIIDQLNLTKTKKQKKISEAGINEADTAQSIKAQSKQSLNITTADAESSSDSIDLQLLFSEDSNVSDDIKDKNVSSQKESGTEKVEDFIPLKRTPGKINILTGQDNNDHSAAETTLNESSKKKNKKKKSQGPIDEHTSNVDQADDIQIVIDTQGTHESPIKPINISLTLSMKKKKNRSSVTFQDNSILDVATNDDAPEEVPYESTKKNKKNRKSSEAQDIEVHTSEDLAEKLVNTSSNLSSAKKKKKRVSETHSEETKDATESSLNVSMGSKKKNKHNIMDKNASHDFEDAEDNKEDDKNVSIGSAKKQKASKRTSQIIETESDTISVKDNNVMKRKRESNTNDDNIKSSEHSKGNPNMSDMLNESMASGSQKKKRKITHNEDLNSQNQGAKVTKKKNKKRKERDDDAVNSVSKIFKENSFDKVHVTRLPTSIINELEEKPKKEVRKPKKSVISTTPFIVEDSRKRRNKPSKFLEESVYLKDSHVEKKQKGNIKKPKVLPFIPTAVTSSSGFTTSFKINVIPQEVQFVAQTKNVANFKNEYLYGKKIKRLGTYETYKKHRTAKMSKF